MCRIHERRRDVVPDGAVWPPFVVVSTPSLQLSTLSGQVHHLFGDIFGRDILDFQTREVATIAALASMKGVEGQLQSHIGVALNVGITAPQIGSLIATLEAKVGKTESETAGLALTKVLAGRNK